MPARTTPPSARTATLSSAECLPADASPSDVRHASAPLEPDRRTTNDDIKLLWVRYPIAMMSPPGSTARAFTASLPTELDRQPHS
eukprot:426545-Prorocentrum_minimum.AAC.2